jgi:hypothetical protein
VNINARDLLPGKSSSYEASSWSVSQESPRPLQDLKACYRLDKGESVTGRYPEPHAISPLFHILYLLDQCFSNCGTRTTSGTWA